MIGGTFLKVQKFLIKNAPTILATMGAIGTVAAVVMSSDSSIKAKKILESAEFKNRNKELCDKYLSEESRNNEAYSPKEMLYEMINNGIRQDELNDICKKESEGLSTLSTSDKALIYAKTYAPTLVMTAASLACIFGSNYVSQKRIASIAGAYILKTTAFDEYKKKAEEFLGKKKANDISDSIIQDHIDKNPPTDENTVQTTIPNPVQLSLWYDETSDRYFYSNAEYIRKAEIQATKMLQKNGYVGVNDIYSILGLEELPLAENLGWDKEITSEVSIKIGSALCGPDIPCGTIKMEVHPTSAWLCEM